MGSGIEFGKLVYCLVYVLMFGIGAAVSRLRSLVADWTRGADGVPPRQARVGRSSTEAEGESRVTRRGPVAAPAAIQVVDDDQENREILARRLTRDGHQVRMAGGGTEALSVLQAEPVDLVLLDVMMPDLDGPTVLARL